MGTSTKEASKTILKMVKESKYSMATLCFYPTLAHGAKAKLMVEESLVCSLCLT